MRILITGGSSDIAMAIAKRRISMGDEIVITASSGESLKKTLSTYSEQGLTISGIVFNFADPTGNLEALGRELEQGLDAIIFNAFGRMPKLSRLHELPFTELSQYLNENILGNTFLIHQALPKMMERKFGRLIFVSSISAAIGTANYGVYSCAKSALEGLFLNLAADYAENGILSNIVRLGLFKTSRTSVFWKRSAYIEKVADIIPQRVLGEPDQAAEAIDGFLSKTSYINGATLAVSGGLPLHAGPRRSV